MKKFLVALMVIVLAFSSISVMAKESPTAQKYYKVTVDGTPVKKDGDPSIKRPGGKISVIPGKVPAGKKVVLIATPDKGNKFSRWIIKGDYTIVSGSLTSEKLVVIPKSDIDVDAKFTKNGEEITEAPTKGSNNSPISPKTGYGATAGVAVIMLLAGIVAAITKKRAF